MSRRRNAARLRGCSNSSTRSEKSRPTSCCANGSATPSCSAPSGTSASAPKHRDRSDFDLAAELDDAVCRDAEELGGVEHGVGHQDEDLLAPAGEGGALRRDDLLAAQEERGFHQVEAELQDAALRQRARDVRLVHEAIVELEDMEVVVEMADLDAALLGDVRNVLGLHVHQHDPLVQHLVVLEV